MHNKNLVFKRNKSISGNYVLRKPIANIYCPLVNIKAPDSYLREYDMQNFCVLLRFAACMVALKKVG